jgi:hypothetical protein
MRYYEKLRFKMSLAVDFNRIHLPPFVITNAAKPTCKRVGRIRKIGVETAAL